MQINILEAIADALYSNSELVIDSISDLIDTMLKIDSLGNNVSSGLSIAQAVLGAAFDSNSLLMAQQVAGDNIKARLSILAELVSAVGLQRLRFTERQHKGRLSLCFASSQIMHRSHGSFVVLNLTQCNRGCCSL